MWTQIAEEQAQLQANQTMFDRYSNLVKSGGVPRADYDDARFKVAADTASVGHTISGHTASDVPLSATGPGAWQFVGVYENTDVFLKILRASTGRYRAPGTAPSPPSR